MRWDLSKGQVGITPPPLRRKHSLRNAHAAVISTQWTGDTQHDAHAARNTDRGDGRNSTSEMGAETPHEHRQHRAPDLKQSLNPFAASYAVCSAARDCPLELLMIWGRWPVALKRHTNKYLLKRLHGWCFSQHRKRTQHDAHAARNAYRGR